MTTTGPNLDDPGKPRPVIDGPALLEDVLANMAIEGHVLTPAEARQVWERSAAKHGDRLAVSAPTAPNSATP